MARKKLGEMLVEAGVLSEQGLRMALNEQKRWGRTLGHTLVDMKLVSEPELVQVLSKQLNLPTIDLDQVDVHPTVLELVPGELAEHYNLVPFAQPMKFLDVAMADPTNLGIIDELRIRTQLNIRPYLAGPKMIERALGKHYRRGFGRMIPRRGSGDEIPLDTGDTVSFGAAAKHAPLDPAEIEAARRREGLRPAPKPMRPSPYDLIGPTQPPGASPAAATVPIGPPALATRDAERDAEIQALQERISKLEALVARDEDVLRKLLALLVEKGVATREEILEAIR